ncbi:penicillin acylase family protein [Acidovorax sp. GBBC 3334]|uniref:penicillin acylase family protein n=1 Tax=Acidovorax sp. GBBC 3334 TaxID=2940496 RepID=UPI0023047874|nr:penicillin acylase family protein [Acidovorax sp. GBBC 3334]MDA8453363.1 penicillin acylase family protein [Acidovorax sp. GBBC 3334]
MHTHGTTGRPWGRWLAAAAVALPLLAGAGAAVYVQKSFPALDGRTAAPGLRAPVQVRRDTADVTHIQASSPQDLWFGLGYVHAQERSWQLEFNRRLMHGRLSEVFGPATLETDKLMRALDIMGAARRQYAGLPAVAQEALQAYSRGIQRFHQGRTQALPPEFLLLGVTPGEDEDAAWLPEDSVGWALMMALDMGGNWGQEFARLSLARVLDTDRLWQALPPYPGEPPATSTDLAALYRGLGIYRAGEGAAPPQGLSPGASAPAQASAAVPAPRALALLGDGARQWLEWSQALVRDAGTNEGKGSNNWVVAGERTASGKPLLANDPHLGLSAPAIWYYAALHSPEGTAADGTRIPAMEVAGATLPGLPFVVLGRTAGVAWGFTNTSPDVQDLYLEQIDPAHPRRYRTPEGWADFVVRTESIRVKGQPDVSVTLRATRHGPVLSDAQASHGRLIDLDRYVVALRWSALDADNQTVLAGLRLNHAQSVGGLFDALSDYHSPMQNVVAADVQGRIAFKAVGRVPVRDAANDLRGVAPAPGWDARYDWQGWVPYAETPQGDGAGRGWIATANQRVAPEGYPHFLTQDWALPYRYDRIAQQLGAAAVHDMAGMQRLQGDVVSLATVRLLPYLQRALQGHPHPLAADAAAQLRGFDGAMRADRAAPLVFAAWVDELARGTLGARIGAERFSATYGKRDYRAGLEGILERGDAWWCQPVTCERHAADAAGRALDRLQAAQGAEPARWQWGRAHAAVSTHRPFSNVPALARFFEVRVPSPGDAYTVNVGQYDAGNASGPFVNRHAASLRAIYDLADLEASRFIYQTGQSGLVFSPRYRDMRDEWAGGGYRPLQLRPARWAHALTLVP